MRWAPLFQFVPLSVFATYAFWNGPPVPERWPTAFLLGAAVAVIQLALTLARREPLSRLGLGANLYLLVGGLAALGRRWEVLEFYGVLKESAIFVSMLLVGVVTTIWSASGYVGVPHPDGRRVRLFSSYLLALTLVALGMSWGFPGNGAWSVGVPSWC